MAVSPHRTGHAPSLRAASQPGQQAQRSTDPSPAQGECTETPIHCAHGTMCKLAEAPLSQPGYRHIHSVPRSHPASCAVPAVHVCTCRHTTQGASTNGKTRRWYTLLCCPDAVGSSLPTHRLFHLPTAAQDPCVLWTSHGQCLHTAIAVSHQQLLHKCPFQTPARRAASPGRLAKPQP